MDGESDMFEFEGNVFAKSEFLDDQSSINKTESFKEKEKNTLMKSSNNLPQNSKSVETDKLELLQLINNKLLSEKLMKVFSSYDEELKKAQLQLVEKDKDIEVIKKKSLNPLDMSENKLHFVFLFSSPLVKNKDQKITKVPLINWRLEIEDILDSLKKVNYKLNYKVNVATQGMLG